MAFSVIPPGGGGVGLGEGDGDGDGDGEGEGEGEGVGGGGAWVRPENRSRFGEPEPGDKTTPWVALETIASETAAGVADGFDSRYRAATPATCGVAIEVPLIVLTAVSPDPHAEVMFTPGANTSTQFP